MRAKKITESEGRELKGQAGRYLSNSKFNGDDCLAIQSVWVQYKIYSIDLSHLMKGAAAVEDCVLKKAKGACNSVGTGSTRAELQTLTDAISRLHEIAPPYRITRETALEFSRGNDAPESLSEYVPAGEVAKCLTGYTHANHYGPLGVDVFSNT